MWRNASAKLKLISYRFNTPRHLGCGKGSSSFARFLAAVIAGVAFVALSQGRVAGQPRNLPPLGEGQSAEEEINDKLADAENAERDADEAKLSRPGSKSTEGYVLRAESRRAQAASYINSVIESSTLKPKDVAAVLRRRAKRLRDRAKRDREEARKTNNKPLRDLLDRLADADDRNSQQYENQADQVEKNGHL
jgi:hypothetical protein